MEILGKIFGQVPSAGRLNSLRTAEHRPTSVCRSARFAVCLSLAMLISPVWLVAQGTLGRLTLLDAPVLAIDDSGTVVLQFRNDGRSNVNLALTASEIANAAGKRSNAKVVLKTVADLDGKTLVETKEVPPGNYLYVRAEVSNVLQDGDWEFEVHNHGAKIGVFKITRAPVPFAVKLDVPDSGTPEISLQSGAPKHLSFKNDDDRAYPVSWEFVIDGKNGKAPIPPAPGNKGAGETGLTLPAHGTGQFSVIPPGEWFGWKTLLKDETTDGWLTVRLRRPECAAEGCEPSPDAPSRTFHIKVNLAGCSKDCQAVWADVFVFTGVLLGALFSFFANLVLPNYFRRRDLIRSLNQIEARISSLPVALASRLRVLAATERTRLQGSSMGSLLFSLKFRGRITELEQSAQQLESYVDLLEKMGSDRIRFEALREAGAPPTLVDQIEDLFEEAMQTLDVVAFTESARESAKTKVSDIEKRINDLQKPGPEFGRQLVERAKGLRQEFALDRHHPAPPSATRDRMCKRVRGLWNHLRLELGDANNLVAAEYAKWDMVLYKLDLIRRYVDWRDAGKRADRVNPSPDEIETELVRRLLLFSWEGLDAARRYIQEMEENIFAEDMGKQIRHVSIHTDRFLVRPFAPTQFHLEFTDRAYDTATAQRDWTCVWYFDHRPVAGDLPCPADHDNRMREYGWIVTHYFPDDGCFAVSVGFSPHTGGPEITGPKSEIPVQLERPRQVQPRRPTMIGRFRAFLARQVQPWRPAMIELFQIFLAILPALLALMAGGKDQLLKLDLFPAFLAIFALGFGSDQIKNKLVPPAPAAPAPRA